MVNEQLTDSDRHFEFCQAMFLQLAPQGILEQCLADEIAGATWRLRCCDATEERIRSTYQDNFPNQETRDKQDNELIRNLIRSRDSAHRILHRCIAQLGKLQTSREIGFELSEEESRGLADPKQVQAARRRTERHAPANEEEEGEEINLSMTEIEELCSLPQSALYKTRPTEESGSNCNG